MNSGILPLYFDADPNALRHPKGHAGLWYERFFNRYEDNQKDGFHVPKEGKSHWIKKVKGSMGVKDDLVRQSLIIQRLVEPLGGATRIFVNDWHFVTGLGNPHPVENGFTWHPTLGVPYLPGSAVKGMLRSYIEVWREDYHSRIPAWFGGVEKQEPAQAAGGLIFFDALPIEPPELAADIMTPHMGDWYAKGAKEPGMPGDWHDPTPVPFLAAKHIKLLFAVAPRNPALAEHLPEVLKLLEEALEITGAGAKTAVGYGLMQPDREDEQAQNKLFADTQAQNLRRAHNAEVDRQELLEAQALARLHPQDQRASLAAQPVLDANGQLLAQDARISDLREACDLAIAENWRPSACETLHQACEHWMRTIKLKKDKKQQWNDRLAALDALRAEQQKSQ